MESLPSELLCDLCNLCDLHTVLALRNVCYRFYALIDDYLLTRTTLHVWNEYGAYMSDPSSLNLDRMILFIRSRLPGLQELSLDNIPVRVSLSTLIKIAASTPNIYKLNISHSRQRPSIDANAVYALPYFKRLRSLTMNGWDSVDRMSRGCVHHECLIPIETLVQLREWKVCGAARALGNTLNNMRRRSLVLPSIESVCFGFDTACTYLEAPIIWFLSKHSTIRIFQLCNSIFAGRQALNDLYQALQGLPRLEIVVLSDCWICDGVDQAAVSVFLQKMRQKRVTVEGSVRSFRYSPNNALMN